MASVTEKVGKSLQSVLDLGVNTLSSNQTVTFTQYVRVVLPQDGFIFWVKADLLSESALYNAYKYNQLVNNALPRVETPAKTITVQGSFHYSTIIKQEEDATNSSNYLVFTAETEIVDFNSVGSNVIYLGQLEGFKFSFSRMDSYYKQSDLYHYKGLAVQSPMSPQIIDNIAQLDPTRVVVSNSLPIWLTLNQYFPIYPSFAVPNNTMPPYASIHIDPVSTLAIASAPTLDGTMSHYQLVEETARITIYGVRNDTMLDWMDYVFQYTLDYDTMGIMNLPTVRDDKRTQVELNTLAQKKTAVFKINYYQSRVRNVARQLIKTAIPSYILGE